jgi:hypothetical protein
MYRKADVETLALPSRDTIFLTLVRLLDAGFLLRAIRWNSDSPDGCQAGKSKHSRYGMPGHSGAPFQLIGTPS